VIQAGFSIKLVGWEQDSQIPWIMITYDNHHQTHSIKRNISQHGNMSTKVKGTKHYLCGSVTSASRNSDPIQPIPLISNTPMTSHDCARKKNRSNTKPGLILARWDSSGSDQRLSCQHLSMARYGSERLRGMLISRCCFIIPEWIGYESKPWHPGYPKTAGWSMFIPKNTVIIVFDPSPIGVFNPTGENFLNQNCQKCLKLSC